MFQIEPLVFSDAVRHFWQTRDQQANKQAQHGASDQGARSAVTGGKQLDGFALKIAELMVTVGVKSSNIYLIKKRELPGYFRPTKQWDIIAVDNGNLLCAIELKSQVGPSFGNNFNNRTEEALGSAVDIWTAYREQAFLASPAPWLGYLFLLEDCYESRNNGKTIYEPHFKVFPEFRNVPYSKRYELLCRKLVLERHYNAACFIMTDHKKASLRENYLEPAEDLTANRFLSQLLRHVSKCPGQEK